MFITVPYLYAFACHVTAQYVMIAIKSFVIRFKFVDF